MAGTPNHSVASLRKQLADLTTAIGSVHLRESERHELLDASRSLVRKLETPKEKVARMMWHEPLVLTTARVLIDLNIFKALTEAGEPRTVAQLSSTTGADSALLERLLKHIATELYVQETGPDTYQANDYTRTLATPGGEGCVLDVFNLLQVYAKLPEFLQKTKYVCPRDKDASPSAFAWEGRGHYFDWVMQDPKRIAATHGHMEFKNLGPQWYEEPEIVESALGAGVDADGVLMVDVGGNGGHQSTGFRRRHPDMPGRLVLQDLPRVVDNLDREALAKAGVEARGHDFFAPQPIVGAKAYYVKMVSLPSS